MNFNAKNWPYLKNQINASYRFFPKSWISVAGVFEFSSILANVRFGFFKKKWDIFQDLEPLWSRVFYANRAAVPGCFLLQFRHFFECISKDTIFFKRLCNILFCHKIIDLNCFKKLFSLRKTTNMLPTFHAQFSSEERKHQNTYVVALLQFSQWNLHVIFLSNCSSSPLFRCRQLIREILGHFNVWPDLCGKNV